MVKRLATMMLALAMTLIAVNARASNVGQPYGTAGSVWGWSVTHTQYIRNIPILWYGGGSIGWQEQQFDLPLDTAYNNNGIYPAYGELFDLALAGSAMGTNLLETYGTYGDPYINYTMDWVDAPAATHIVGTIGGYAPYKPGAAYGDPQMANADAAFVFPEGIDSYSPCYALEGMAEKWSGSLYAWPVPPPPGSYNGGCQGDPDSGMYHTSIWNYPPPPTRQASNMGLSIMAAVTSLSGGRVFRPVGSQRGLERHRLRAIW